MLLEICAGNLASAINAQLGGADRIELCSALELGGLSPSEGLIRMVKERIQIPVYVLIRPRAGDFEYSLSEKLQTLKEIECAIKAGADGIVCGALMKGAIDGAFAADMRKLSPETPFTFHRAFDLTENRLASLDLLVDLNYDCVLTSGAASNALEGQEELKAFVDYSNKRLDILVGSGVHSSNIVALQKATGATFFHASAKTAIQSSTTSDIIDPQWYISDLGEIKLLKQALKTC